MVVSGRTVADVDVLLELTAALVDGKEATAHERIAPHAALPGHIVSAPAAQAATAQAVMLGAYLPVACLRAAEPGPPNHDGLRPSRDQKGRCMKKRDELHTQEQD